MSKVFGPPKKHLLSRPFRVPNTNPHKVSGWFWKTRERNVHHSFRPWSNSHSLIANFNLKELLHFFPERRVEGRFLGAVSLSSMTSLAWFKLLNLNLLDLTCLTKTFLISLSWLDLGKLLTWLAKPTCFTWLAKLTCLTDLFNWLA